MYFLKNIKIKLYMEKLTKSNITKSKSKSKIGEKIIGIPIPLRRLIEDITYIDIIEIKENQNKIISMLNIILKNTNS